jgi:hypothetical protein
MVNGIRYSSFARIFLDHEIAMHLLSPPYRPVHSLYLTNKSSGKVAPAKESVAKTNKTNAKAKKSEGGRGTGDDTGNTEERILDFLWSMLHDGEKESVPESEVLFETGYKRADSTGFRIAIKSLTKEKCYVKKNSKAFTLTEEGRKYMQGRKPVIERKTNKEVEDYFKAMVIKSGKGKIPPSKLDDFWDILRDRKVHDEAELLKKLGYQRTDSTGYRMTVRGLKTLDLIEKNGKGWQFTGKVFPFSN